MPAPLPVPLGGKTTATATKDWFPVRRERIGDCHRLPACPKGRLLPRARNATLAPEPFPASHLSEDATVADHPPHAVEVPLLPRRASTLGPTTAPQLLALRLQESPTELSTPPWMVGSATIPRVAPNLSVVTASGAPS